MKKVLALLLAAIMALGLLAGCGSKGGETGQDSTAGKVENVPEYMNASGFPIVKQTITVKVMGSRSATHGEWKDMDLFKKMEQVTGIHLEFDTPMSTAYTEKKNLALASEDLPDVFMAGSITAKDEETYGPQGMFIQHEKYIDQYAPNVKRVFEKYPEAKKIVTALDGHIYSIPYICDTKTRASAIMYINMDWLKKAGVKKPTNVDEFYSALKAFRDNDMNGNGKQDEVPLSYYKQSSPTGGILYSIFLAAFSGQTGGASFDVKDSKVIYNPAEPYFKDMLIYFNKLYSEGLVDTEIFSQSLQQMTAKYKEGKMGICTTSLSNVLDPSDKTPYEVISPLISEKNSKKVTPQISTITSGNYVITSKCKYPEAMMRWIDVLFREADDAVEGLCGLSNFLGEYGYHWTYGDAEKKTYTRISKIEGMNPVEYQNKYVAPQSFGYVVTGAVPDNDPLLLLKATESDKEYHPYMIPGLPALRYPEEQQSNLAQIENDLQTYVGQWMAKFITGETPFSKWDEYLANLKKMKVDEALKIKQEAYDKWNNTK